MSEQQRLQAHTQRKSNWKQWGPYLSERAWGTVREDYSAHGEVWEFFPHEHARSRAYRWNEDGLGGISDRNQYLCFAPSLWNGKDPFLKERLFGLTNPEGNHGEDVKEYYFYLDNTPTHSYMKMLYKYPQGEFPYQKLVQENRARGLQDSEYELLNTDIFHENRYFDFTIEYAKESEEDILIKLTLQNRGKDSAECVLIPTLWFRNTWSWGYAEGPMGDVPGKPKLIQGSAPEGISRIQANHPTLGVYHLYLEGSPEILFTENETNTEKLLSIPNSQLYVKDAFHNYIVRKNLESVNPHLHGTKAGMVYKVNLPSNGSMSVRLRLSNKQHAEPFVKFESIFQKRILEANEFYQEIQNPELDEEEKMIQRQALAGMLWNKQLYYFDAEQWIHGDPLSPFKPSPSRKLGRNKNWEHLVNFDILSMPDKWEYPWYASWDLAFHCIALVLIDTDFAKRQLTLMTREWYLHPNGQLPAYEWEFSEVNPPVLAWAAWRVYKIDLKKQGKPDIEFLKGLFNKLLLNFTWWVNIKDAEGKNIFQGGFLGMDNISVFDRSKPLPMGGRIDQSDGTAWMGFYCVTMMKIALELSKYDTVYQDSATKFFEHFLRIAGAMRNCGGRGIDFWNEEDGFYYDSLQLPNGELVPLKVRSLVGLLPLLAVETLEPEPIKKTPVFERRVEWFISKKPKIAASISSVFAPGMGARRLMSLMNKEKLQRVLKIMLDENEFLSDYGIRSLSKYHEKHPYIFHVDGVAHTVKYEPGESQTRLFGGNSNWRGPIWFPINLLIIESLQKFHHYYGDNFKVEFPTGSGRLLNLWEVSMEISKRLTNIFKKNSSGRKAVFGKEKQFDEDPYWKDQILFYEFFHGETGAGLGASHQTGWTGTIAKIIQQSGGIS